MVKVRMNTADVAAEVKCLRSLIGMRCSNVYDITPKTYMFKLMNSSGVTESGESEKVLLLMESGVRLHTTAYVRDKSFTPSGFTLKLRKHIRTRRLEDVRQLGYDRIVLFQFGLGANAHYVILELYAQGNIILTDSDFMVLTLLRSHRDDDKGFAIMSRHRYPAEICRVFEHTTLTKLQTSLASKLLPDNPQTDEVHEAVNNMLEIQKEKQSSRKGGKSVDSSKSKSSSDSARAKQLTLKSVLGDALGYGPALSEHIILDAGLIPNAKIAKDYIFDEQTIQVLVQAVDKFEDWLEGIISGDTVPEGYILMQIKSTGKKDITSSDAGSSPQIYDEFCPILLNQFKSRDSVKFDTFDAALDEFYSKIESQRSEQQLKAKEESAVQKLSKIRSDQENRVLTLSKEVDRCVGMAELIEYNLEDVEAAILAVRVALANGMSWEDLARMVKEEKKSGNPVAGIIDKLHLEKNCMTLLLSNNLDEMDDDEKTLPVDKVEVDLALSAHANARRWYEMKKRQESKQEKTVTAHEKAFKAAEKKTRFQLSQEKTVASISHMRKVHWFEKFNWFISSENYLVISGRDAQQNEMVVKRYMSKGDLYVHAELHGASSTVIKNHNPDNPVPPLTLNQAGCFTVCHSQAWDSKMVTSAWWVYPHQVSKTAPTGEYLTVGSFMIRGKKNYLPPHPLIMGFGMLFRVDESSLGSHLNERRVRGEEEGVNENEEASTLTVNSESEEELAENTTVAESKSIPDVSVGDHEAAVSDVVSSRSGKSESRAKFAKSVKISEDTAVSLKAGEDSGKSSPSISSQLEDLIDRALEIGPATVSRKKNYGLETCEIEFPEERNQDESKAVVRDKPYISKAERRKLKKGGERSSGAGEATAADIEKEKENSVENNGSLGREHPKKDVENLKASKFSRGQKAKLKKMKEKYADQDEEERSLKMTLLASSGKVDNEEKETDDGSRAPEKKIEPATGGTDDASKICYKCKKMGHLSRDCVEQHQVVETAGDGTMMDRVTMEEDDIHEIGEEEKEKLKDVDYLTGNPLATDIILYAVPVCAPYSAVQTYKYRVKIIPGSAKRGKGAKTAMNLFNQMGEATSREKEVMKACTEAELVAAILGNVKITSAGLTQLKQKQKQGKKNASKKAAK